MRIKVVMTIMIIITMMIIIRRRHVQNITCLMQASLSQHAYVENNNSFKHWGKHTECQEYQC